MVIDFVAASYHPNVAAGFILYGTRDNLVLSRAVLWGSVVHHAVAVA